MVAEAPRAALSDPDQHIMVAAYTVDGDSFKA